jgi:hypothetical protein
VISAERMLGVAIFRDEQSQRNGCPPARCGGAARLRRIKWQRGGNHTNATCDSLDDGRITISEGGAERIVDAWAGRTCEGPMMLVKVVGR